jgi:hypothetical protein
LVTGAKVILIIGAVLLGLGFMLVVGLGLLVFLLDEASEDREFLAELGSLLPFSFSNRAGIQANEGDEFTGQFSGWLFGIGSLPVILCLVARFVGRRVSQRSGLKNVLAWFNRLNNKLFMPFHTYLSLLAFGLALLHFLSSSCPNPFPEWGLLIAGILVISGLLIKLRIASKVFPKSVKFIYRFHASLLVSGILVAVLLAGHTLMD